MRREQKDVIILSAGKQMDAQQRPMFKVKSMSSFFGEELLHMCFAPAARIFMEESYRQLFTDSLHRTAIHGRERGSQAAMAVHQCLERLLQCGHINSRLHSDGLRHIVGSTLRRQLMEKPQALLAIRERIFGWCQGRVRRDFVRALAC